MRYCLGVDVAAVDSMYCLAAETGEIIFMPVKSPHTKTGFQWILEKLDGIEQQDIRLTASLAAFSEQPQWRAMVFMLGQHTSFCPAQQTR